MNSLALSLASQIGVSRRHFFVVNWLAFPLANFERQSDPDSGHGHDQFHLAILAGISVL
jgi:hypothetical protein